MFHIKYFGFTGWHEFFVTLVKPKLFALMGWSFAPFITFLSSASVLIERFFGIPAVILFIFIMLNFVEWFTGVKASLAEGKSFSSNKLSRAAIKTMVYVSMLFALHQYQSASLKDANLGILYLYAFSYWAVFHIVSLVLVRSIFENLHRMGVKEAKIIFDFLNNKYLRVFAIIASPPDEEKAARK